MAKLIAELCQNHNGDINILEEMVAAAAESGADYAKIQSIDSDELTFRERFENGLEEGGIYRHKKRPYKDEYERLKKLDLNEETQINFHNLCKKHNIEAQFIGPQTAPIEKVHTYYRYHVLIKTAHTHLECLKDMHESAPVPHHSIRLIPDFEPWSIL